MGGIPIKQLGLGAGHRPVKKLQIQVVLALPKHAAHEIVHPEGGVDPAQQVSPPVLDGLRGTPVQVDREIQENPGLEVLVGFLHQLNFAGEGGLTQIRRPAHRLLAHRFGEHVEAEGPQVPLLERLQVDDRGVDRPLPGGANVVIRKTLPAQLHEVPVQLGRGDPQRKPDPLDSRIALGYLQAGDEGGERALGHRFTGLEEPAGGQQGLFVVAEAGLDPCHGVAATVVEIGMDLTLLRATVAPPSA